MPSLTEIANFALSMIGDERVASLETDTSKAAQLCNQHMNEVRRACLVMHPWNFASRRASLPALATAPLSEWTAQYQVPAGCLRVLRVVSDDPHEPWTREGDLILCNMAAPLGIRYIADFTDVGRFPPLFVRMMAADLAEQLALPLSASQAARNSIAQIGEDIRRRARSVDAAEGTPDPAYAPAGVFVEARA